MQTDLSNNNLLDFTTQPLMKNRGMRRLYYVPNPSYFNATGDEVVGIGSASTTPTSTSTRPTVPVFPTSTPATTTPVLYPQSTAPAPISSSPTAPIAASTVSSPTVIYPTETAPAQIGPKPVATTVTPSATTTSTTSPIPALSTDPTGLGAPMGGGGGGGGMAPAPEQSSDQGTVGQRMAPIVEKTNIFKSFWFWGLVAGAAVGYYLVKKKGYSPKKTYLLSMGTGGALGYGAELLYRKYKGIGGTPQMTNAPQQTPAPQPSTGQPAM